MIIEFVFVFSDHCSYASCEKLYRNGLIFKKPFLSTTLKTSIYKSAQSRLQLFTALMIQYITYLSTVLFVINLWSSVFGKKYQLNGHWPSQGLSYWLPLVYNVAYLLTRWLVKKIVQFNREIHIEWTASGVFPSAALSAWHDLKFLENQWRWRRQIQWVGSSGP